ncbi:MAG: hypothetical protein A3C56_06615 [Ignavibacteria bacterium RIFCSPHIGHO2_02_FULL_56_12]|nr:MAG: hypothetical protein A3C56_06615 [Ignavibacteria bacterium RIFCSPHIGHO2_02_FULL_56_12]
MEGRSMKPRHLTIVFAAHLILTVSAFPQSTKVDSGYVPVNGLQLYYEVHGTGKPLVLLHGGLGAIEMFGPALTALAEKRMVIAVDFQGHGRTTDIDRPLSYDAFAVDIAGLLRHLRIEKCDIIGYSLGAGTALSVASRHPELVGLLGGGKKDGRWDGSGKSKSQLAILPGRTHYDIFSAPELVSTALTFLDSTN